MRAPALVLLLAAAGLILAGVGSAWRPEPQVRGSDEIYYLDFRGLALQPGDSWGQDVPVQQPGLSRISFPYRVVGDTSGRIRVRIETGGGRALVDRLIELPATPAIDSPQVWLEPTFWGPVARFADVLVSGAPPDGALKVSFYVPPGSPAVSLFWNALDPNTGRAISYPAGTGPESTPARRALVSTGYGDIRPAPLRFWTLEERVGRLAPPWLPHPLPALLILAAAVLAAAAVWSIAQGRPYPPPDVRAEAGDDRLAGRPSPRP